MSTQISPKNVLNANTSMLFIDIGANLTDSVFHGVYRGKKKHEDDFGAVLFRAKEAGVEKMLVTGSNLVESKTALDLCVKYEGFLFATVGLHPCHAGDDDLSVNPGKYYSQLEQLALDGAKAGVVKAFGEFGLDYDRFHFADKEKQLEAFERQLEIAIRVQLPLFLHSRACAEDFERILAPALKKLPRGGVVHSFTGSLEEMQRLLDLGLSIGVNGCSLKSEENLAVAGAIPLDRLLLETDAPWCEIRPSHASYKHVSPLAYPSSKPEKFNKGLVRGRCEPCSIGQVAEAVAAVRGCSVEDVAEAAYRNAHNMFWSH